MRRASLASALIGLALAGSLLVACAPAPAASAPASAPDQAQAIPAEVQADWEQVLGSGPTYYGVEYAWVDQDRELYLERYRLLQPNLLRVQVTQEYFEPANDNPDPQFSEINFDLTLPLDIEMGKTLTYRDLFTTLGHEFPAMHFHINVWLAARWNASDPDGYLGLGGAFPPLDDAEHAEFVRELARWLVETCGIAPQRLSFSFINEPNLSPFFVGTQADLVLMAQVTRAALDQVSAQIGLLGLDEVHGTAVTDAFYPQRPAGCCDAWTFHAYNRGTDALWASLQERSERLSAYGPVWVTEFADTTNGSPDAKMDFSSREAALGFAELGGRLWASGIDGLVHFRLSDSYIDFPPLEGWSGHGLFADWRGTRSNGEPYALYPAFWVFANLYGQLGGGEVVQTSASPGLVVTGVRHTGLSPSLALWVTNPSAQASSIQVQLANFPTGKARVEVLDNLAGPDPVQAFAVSGKTGLAFEVQAPAGSSLTLRVLPQDGDTPILPPTPTPGTTPPPGDEPGWKLYMPVVVR